MFEKFFKKKGFTDSASYWEKRYARGGNSGEGSYGELARFKAEVLNNFVRRNDIQSVIEFGCGDGNQLQLADYRSYIGLDISPTAVERCRSLFKQDSTKKFKPTSEYSGEKAELALSLDVIYHLVEDTVFDNYMRMLFSSSDKFVIIYSNDVDGENGETKPHVRFRKFTEWVKENAPDWILREQIPNGFPALSTADFFIYEKASRPA